MRKVNTLLLGASMHSCLLRINPRYFGVRPSLTKTCAEPESLLISQYEYVL